MENDADDSQLDVRDAVCALSVQLPLTDRQAEVLHWTAEGKSNDEIAIILGCSINTVKGHLKDIFLRLGVHTRTAASASAYRAYTRNVRRRPLPPERVIPQEKASP